MFLLFIAIAFLASPGQVFANGSEPLFSTLRLSGCTKIVNTPPDFLSPLTGDIAVPIVLPTRIRHVVEAEHSGILLPNPFENPDLEYNSGIRLVSRDGEHFLGFLAGGHRRYFRKNIHEQKETLYLTQENKEIRARFTDFTKEVEKNWHHFEEKHEGFFFDSKNKEELVRFSTELADFQISRSVHTSFSFEWSKNQEGETARNALKDAYKYALSLRRPIRWSDVKKLHKMVLRGATLEIQPGTSRGQRNLGLLKFSTLAFLERGERMLSKFETHGKEGSILREQLLNAYRVPLAVDWLKSNMADLQKTKNFKEILFFYRNFMLIHPFYSGAISRIARIVQAKILVDAGFDPRIKGEFKNFFLYNDDESYIWNVMRANLP